ncbi:MULTISPECIES: hypothetical protein [Clostridium]|jgi:hypothetical protein|uniref:Lipoprotein n=1 Tax=Clostridium saudiense TaxID=1414720 RepID=A0ABS2FEE5_9CLOT|nr:MULTISPECIES: hypothetical protein [Clostridium]MBM6818701.1 hypothetical protein [Clostridium saudiense]
MKRIILLVLVVLANLFLIGCVESKVYLNKNNEELKDINKEELESIVDEYSSYVIDEIYVADTKIVGFSTDNTQGVFVYEKDNEGNYVLNQANKLDIPIDGLGISNYRIIYQNYNDITNAKYGYIVISNGKKVSRVEITINDVYKYNANLEIGKESMVLIKENLTDDESAGIRLDVKYFDENNNELLQ